MLKYINNLRSANAVIHGHGQSVEILSYLFLEQAVKQFKILTSKRGTNYARLLIFTGLWNTNFVKQCSFPKGEHTMQGSLFLFGYGTLIL